MDDMPTIDALLAVDEMDESFRIAFESVELCQKKVDKMCAGASVSTPTPAAENNARGWCPRERGAVRKGFLGG